MNIVNFANKGRIVYLFVRNDKGQLEIQTDPDYYPYYFEPAEDGKFLSYDGKNLKKVVVSNPSDIKKMCSTESYANDIKYSANYITDNIEKFTKAPIKCFFIDIEILTEELPDVKLAKQPISCITIYDSLNKQYKCFFIANYRDEEELLNDFVSFVKKESPDIWLSWNVNFDYQYLHNRIKDFARKISPIDASRPANLKDVKDIWYPCGISICDYLLMFKKVNLRENSYNLNAISEKHLGKSKTHKVIDFSKITPQLRERNIEDVKIMVDLEEKFHIMEYFDEVRRFAKCQWEDLTHNSVILDSIFIQEAKNAGYVLPSRPKNVEENDEDELQGAYRRSDSGVFHDIFKADVGSMYPNQIVNFCLDPTNIVTPGEGACNEVLEEGKDIININGVYFKQDENALIPYLSHKLMTEKDGLKKKLKEVKANTPEQALLQIKYDAYKGLVNSLYGVTALSSFRLYNNKVASAITFLARDLLHYVEDNMKALGHQVIYTDTDALMYKSDKDEKDLLNEMVQQWGIEKYGKESIDISFEAEGYFDSLLIVGKCHYYGYLNTTKGRKREIKGMEVKRSSSSKYESKFQEELIEKILTNESRENILAWVDIEKDKIKKANLVDFSFPAKVANKKYENFPIFLRAYENTKKLVPGFKVSAGDGFYYTFIKSIGKDSKGKNIDVLAFTTDNNSFIGKDRINWDEVIRRNIQMKVSTIFEAIKWTETEASIF